MPFFCIKNMNIDDFKNIIEPVINRNNCLLWGIEILRGKKKNTLRVLLTQIIIMLILMIARVSQETLIMNLKSI